MYTKHLSFHIYVRKHSILLMNKLFICRLINVKLREKNQRLVKTLARKYVVRFLLTILRYKYFLK